MLISEPLPFVKEFIAALDAALKAHRPWGPGLSFAQRRWLGEFGNLIWPTSAI